MKCPCYKWLIFSPRWDEQYILRRIWVSDIIIPQHSSNWYQALSSNLLDMDLLLPNCNVTYTNESDVSDVSFLKELVTNVTAYVNSSHIYFVDLCYCCNVSIFQSLLRCGGCQLVAYCSKDCQRASWASHKKVCKEFPVVKGKNVLYTSTGTQAGWKKHIAGLRDRAARLPHAVEVAAKSIFRNPRVCRTCREARPDHLKIDCACDCVSYCNQKCAKADRLHKEDCNHLQGIEI